MSCTESLPALVTRAAGRLAEAKSSAEVLEAKRVAESALHYAKLTNAANDTHADCLRIIAIAEIRLADEIDAGQAKGEVASHGGDRKSNKVQAPDLAPATLADLGVDKRRVAEWRNLRDAGGEQVVEAAIDEALSEARAPTKADIARHVRGTFNTGNNEWFTPASYIAAARKVLDDIDLDPASHPIAQQTVRAATFFTREDDGLTKPWAGRVWLNPPYAQPLIAQFIDRLVREHQAGRVSQAIALTNDCTDTSWFHSAASSAAAICFTRGRVKFLNPSGEPVGSPTQGQAFFYFGENVQLFAGAFADIGIILYRNLRGAA